MLSEAAHAPGHGSPPRSAINNVVSCLMSNRLQLFRTTLIVTSLHDHDNATERKTRMGTTAVEMIETMDITVNRQKSLLEPTTILGLQYLGFKINSIDLTIRLTLCAFSQIDTYPPLYQKWIDSGYGDMPRGSCSTYDHLLGCRYLAW